VWWHALCLLVINDRVLKGSGLVPGWLSGKLSDFAFLVVAPVLLFSCLPGRLGWRRAFALGSVVGLYVACDLSHAWSDAVVRFAQRLGLVWRLWPDPTDLLALAVLPITLKLMTTAPPVHGSSSRPVTLQHLGVIFGSLACLATSAPPSFRHNPFLVNRTGDAVQVRVTWILTKLPPETSTAAGVAANLRPSELDDAREVTLSSAQVAALDGPPEGDVIAAGVCSPNNGPAFSSAVAAILEAEGAQPVLMLAMRSQWLESSIDTPLFSCRESPTPVFDCQPSMDLARAAGPDEITLEVADGGYRFVVHSDEVLPGQAAPTLSLAPIDPADVAARASNVEDCRGVRDRHRALWAENQCELDEDCMVLPALGVSDPSQCDVYINRRDAGDGATSLQKSWSMHCVSTAAAGCWGLQQPAACRDARCGPLCPGVTLPTCPAQCPPSARITSGSDCASFFGPCIAENGDKCICDYSKSRAECIPPVPITPECPLSCLRPEAPVAPTPLAGRTATDR
jgi:hypothetical protein